MAPDVAPDPIATVRAFNRIVTETVGALNETYLARGRSLGASRLLSDIVAIHNAQSASFAKEAA